MTPQAALSAFTENGTLKATLIYLRSDNRIITDIQWSVYKASVQVNLDIVGNESRCSKLSPSLRVVPVIMSYDYSTSSSILDVFEDVRAQALLHGLNDGYDLFRLTHLGCLDHNQVIHARPSGLHLSPQTFENKRPSGAEARS
jgi:hypothetical protein